MANKTLFAAPRVNTPVTDTRNNAGGVAYSLQDDVALAIFASVGTFHSTFYTSAEDQLRQIKTLAHKVTPERLAKIAVVARNKGFMKDAPAFLTAVLYLRDRELWKRVFPKVIDNGRMLRTYAQIARSGAAGGVINLSNYSHRRAIQAWFDARSSANIFRSSVGNDPSLVNVLRQAHVRPGTREKEALLRYLFNNEFGWNHTSYKGKGLGSTAEDLPQLVKDYETFKQDKWLVDVPQVDFRQLDSLALEDKHWEHIFRQGGWMFTRMNLNTAVRHNVFKSREMVDLIANRLKDRDAIVEARAFPYQLFTTYQATRKNVPHEISEALQDAVEVALENIPDMGRVVVAVDVSGSMANPITGNRGTATSVTRNVDAAALVASAILRRNKSARVIPFANAVREVSLNPRDTVMTNAEKLSALLGGGTNCSAPLALLNKEQYNADVVVLLSDNESWIDTTYGYSVGTATHEQWQLYKKWNREAKLVCIDFSPRLTTQVKERPDVLQVAGMSDQVFELMADFAAGGNSAEFWLSRIDSVEI